MSSSLPLVESLDNGTLQHSTSSCQSIHSEAKVALTKLTPLYGLRHEHEVSSRFYKYMRARSVVRPGHT